VQDSNAQRDVRWVTCLSHWCIIAKRQRPSSTSQHGYVSPARESTFLSLNTQQLYLWDAAHPGQ